MSLQLKNQTTIYFVSYDILTTDVKKTRVLDVKYKRVNYHETT